MKKLLLLIVFSISFGHLYAQVYTVQSQSYTSQIDSAFSPLLSDSIPYDRLYDRVFPWAGLQQTSSGDTIDFSTLKQAWYELELSRTSTLLTQPYASYKKLRDTAYSSRIKNRVQVAAIAVKIAAIDTMAFIDGRLDSTAAGWDKVAGQASPFNIHNVTLSAVSMDEFVIGKEYTLEMKSEHLKNTDRSDIQSIEVTEPINDIDITLAPDQLTTFSVSDTGNYNLTIRTNFKDGSHFINNQDVTVRDSVVLRSDCDRKKIVIESDIPFQGANESEATTSLADVYYYYHYDENGDCEEVLEKPVIICDGYDPVDDRDIEDIEDLFIFYDNYNIEVSSIEELREQGFDVIIMNFPVIGTAQVNYRNGVKNSNGNYVNRAGRDGGTDFTQRNAFLTVKLIQMVNEQLETNGSDEELGIIGPSMGGQVTRYALAYMEEKHAQGVPDMDHNTRVWISFDSPHHGANIPLGNTGLLASLGYSLNQTTAKEEFENRVNTNAAQQYLINQAVPGIIQSPFFNFNYIGLYQNNTAPRRIQYINNLTSNGLPGSSGWPQNVKRVSVVNSSDKGVMNGTPGEEAIFIKGTAFYGLITVARLQSFLQVDYNNWNRPLFSAGINKLFSGGTYSADVKNGNPPGSIDILPGSKSNSTEAVFNGLVENIEKRAKVEKKRLKPNHTFMPVISALAFNNTNIDWGQRLDDRNLVCTGEIPFDAYLISGTNQSHITITEDIYKYIEYQLINGDVGCSLMCGTYSISGDAQICDGNTNTIHTYTFNGTIANDQTLTWEVTGDLEIDNTTGQTIDVKITTTDGSGEIIAILENDCGDKIKRVFPVAIGTPAIYLSSEFNENGCNFSVTMNSIPFGRTPLSYQWSLDGVNYENGPQTVQTFGFPHRFYGRADWGCGYSTDNIFLEVPEESDCFIEGRMKKISKDQVPKPDWLVYPNPSSNQWNIHIPETAKDSYKLTMFDMGNSVILQQEISKFQSNIEINNTHLSSGLYIIRIQNKTEFITLRALKL